MEVGKSIAQINYVKSRNIKTISLKDETDKEGKAMNDEDNIASNIERQADSYFRTENNFGKNIKELGKATLFTPLRYKFDIRLRGKKGSSIG